ncbi:MAG: carboxymuconolactone decarboxylase family protein [Rhodanobacter sp.]|nr:MAG: carboxymuconolactone decarboxylase family protein [Rhodanobacter sp.]
MAEAAWKQRYIDLFGHLPAHVQARIDLAASADRISALDAIETLRDELIHHNPLERKVQQMIHLGMLLVLGHREPARLHAQAAVKAGASATELHGVCETAAIVGGMPAFSLGVQVVTDALGDAQETGGEGR